MRRGFVGISIPFFVIASFLLAPSPATAQDADEPDVVSFFSALAAGFSDTDVFALDAESFALLLQSHLSPALTGDDVEALIGPDFRYGPIDRWVSCGGDVPCQMAYPGTHVALLRVTPEEAGEQLVLRLGRTGGADGGVWRAFESMRVQQVEGRWRLVDAS